MLEPQIKTTKNNKLKIINQLITIILITACNFLLSCQKNTEQYVARENTIKITPLYESEIPQSVREIINEELLEQKTKQSNNKTIQKPAEWLLESSLENAPKLLKGIFAYLQARSSTNKSPYSVTIPSFHRFILVGPPGSGKTTMAYAIAHMLGYPVVFIGASSLLGRFRNETARNIQAFLKAHASDGLSKIIIIDELHKLFELHDNDHADDSQNAAAFWLAIDTIEKQSPNVIIIATANNVDKLPPEIKSRFSGKIITMSLPNKNQKIQAFKNNIAHDKSIMLDKSVNDTFIDKMTQQIQNCSLRDVQLIIDTAKMFYYAETSPLASTFPITLTKAHFQEALDQLQAESEVLQESLLDQACKKLERWGLVFSAAANISVFIRTFIDIQSSSTPSPQNKL